MISQDSAFALRADNFVNPGRNREMAGKAARIAKLKKLEAGK